MRTACFVILCFCVLFGFSACTEVYYRAEVDSKFVFASDEPLEQKPTKIHIEKTASTEEKNFAYLLQEIMIERGFSVSEQDSSCFIDIDFESYSSERADDYPAHIAPFYFMYFPRYHTRTEHRKKISMHLSCIDDANEASRFWDGFADVKVSIYEKYTREIIGHFIDLLGKNYRGYINISQ